MDKFEGSQEQEVKLTAEEEVLYTKYVDKCLDDKEKSDNIMTKGEWLKRRNDILKEANEKNPHVIRKGFGDNDELVLDPKVDEEVREEHFNR